MDNKKDVVSSDDEGETVPDNVSDYEFVSGKDEPVSFDQLPVVWSNERTPEGKLQEIFLRGAADNGLLKIYKRVIAWKFDLSCQKPQIKVLSTEGHWINLLKPRKAFEVIIRTIQITVHFLHFVRWNPERSYKALWDHLDKTFSILESRPSSDDLVDHISLINEASTRDETLAKSKLLSTFLEDKPWQKKTFNEEVKRPFIVDDANGNDDQDVDEMDEDGDDESDKDDCFDSVCAICDNGGAIVLCEGKCMRAFHGIVSDSSEDSLCETLGFTAAELEAIKHFYCDNCLYKQHQCFACGHLGSSDESSGAEVFRCVNGACGHFYHPSCVAKLLHPGNEAAAAELCQKIAAGEQFACPVHKCHVCKELEVRSIPDMQFALCRRCPWACHRKCLPREIAFETDVGEEAGILPRAWEGLLPNRILIYCLKHEIDPDISTPIRNHLKFPGAQKKNIKRLPSDNAANKISAKQSKLVEKMPSGSKQGDLSRKRNENLPRQWSNKQRKVTLNRNYLGKPKGSMTAAGELSLGDRLYSTIYGMDSEPERSSGKSSVHNDYEETQKDKHVPESNNSSFNLDADARRRILDLMKDASSSVALDQVNKRHKAPSTHTHHSKLDNITLGKVEGSVQAVRAALKKLEEGGSFQDAKAVCGNDLLVQVLKWKDKLKVYLAPFLYGMRYTSFGRHFTKINKLKEIIDMLHWYTIDGDMIVDFCCGSNDFSCLLKKKLDEMKKRCSFKNYDIVQAKNDFNFERRDWMKVRPDELPEGKRLIMGLNPPFGVNASLANKFINKALEFKPKLLILVVPRETQRLDEKDYPYDLIWEDDQMLAGKSFYLPGSVDVNDKQMEDWNVTAPVLYLWSRPDWTPKIKAIAEEQGHLAGVGKNYRSDESHVEMHARNSPLECQVDLSFVNQVEESKHHVVKQETLEQEAKPTTSAQEDLPCKSNETKGDLGHALGKNQPETNSNKSNGERKRKRKGTSLEDKSSSQQPASRKRSPSAADRTALNGRGGDYKHSDRRNISAHHSPSLADGPSLNVRGGNYKHSDQINISTRHSPNMADRTSLNGRGGDYRHADQINMSRHRSPNMADPISLNGRGGDYQHPDQRNISTHHAYSPIGYNANHVDDVVKRYSSSIEEPCPSMTSSRLVHSPSPIHDYGFGASSNGWIGTPETANPLAYNRSYPGDMIELYGRDPALVRVHGREEPNSWRASPLQPSYPREVFPSPQYPAANAAYGGLHTSAMQRYAPRLDESNPPPPVPHPGYQVGPLRFAPGPSRAYPRQNNSGWIND